MEGGGVQGLEERKELGDEGYRRVGDYGFYEEKTLVGKMSD